MKRIAGVAVMAALMSFSLVAVAPAHTAKYFDVITLKMKKNGKGVDTFEGKVISKRNRCEADRLVRIKREVAGEKDVLVGKDSTHADGTYSTPAGDPAAGTYYAVATREVLRKSGEHKHVCKRATSNELTVAEAPTP